MSFMTRFLSNRAVKRVEKARLADLRLVAEPKGPLGQYNFDSAAEHGWTLELLHRTFVVAPNDWDDATGFEAVQQALGVRADGWFGPASYRAMMAQHFVHHAVVAGYPYDPPETVHWINWYDPAGKVGRLPSRSRKGNKPTLLLTHESVTTSGAATEKTLARKGLGVQFMHLPRTTIQGKPIITQHGDLAWDRMAHAESQNGPSVTGEIVNPYYDHISRDKGIWPTVLTNTAWAHDGSDDEKDYVVPPLAQLEGYVAMLVWLTTPSCTGGHIDIPSTFVGYADGRLAMGRLSGVNVRTPGIWAHTYTAHADGSFPVLYAFLRLERGMPPVVAYAKAKELATTGKRYALVGTP